MSSEPVQVDVNKAFEPILKVLPAVRKKLSKTRDVVAIRPGYAYSSHLEPVPAVLVAVVPGTTPIKVTDLTHEFHVPFAQADASVDEQLTSLTAQVGKPFASGQPQSVFEAYLTQTAAAIDFAPPRSGNYKPVEPRKLPLVNEKMKATICVSPEAGWSQLKAFLAATEVSLTIGMYQFTAPHIFEAVHQAVKSKNRSLELVLHPIPEPPSKSGTKANDLKEVEEVLQPLKKSLKSRFKFSWATLKGSKQPNGLWASAYHIKVAVRDGKAFWLSSGNWQSSNQPPFDMFGQPVDKIPAGFQSKYNREYHAIIENKKLAAAYEFYLQRDRELTAAQGAAVPFSPPDLFVEVTAPKPVSFAEPPKYFPPLQLNRKLKIQPLLTPDNYVEEVLPLIKSAKKSIWFQNQYINFRGTGEDFKDFKLLVEALKKQVDAGRDVRIICRDMMSQESLDVLVAMGFPRSVFRFQAACHNKTILIDGKTSIFGSHNWSNEGVTTNRDASLIFFDPEVTEYLSQIYDYDWNRRATAKPQPKRVRVAKKGQKPPAGFARVSFTDLFED